MEGLSRFDVAEGRGHLLVIVESAILPPDPMIVVIPLLKDYVAVRGLNPPIRFDGRTHELATRLIAAAPRAHLRKVGNIADQGDLITRAVDVLMGGV